MTVVKATIHGAVSIVNAIATGKGSTLGINSKVEVKIERSPGTGIILESENENISSKLIKKTIQKIVSKKQLQKVKLRVV